MAGVSEVGVVVFYWFMGCSTGSYDVNGSCGVL